MRLKKLALKPISALSAACLLAAQLAAPGCGRQASQGVASNSNAFNTAPSELKDQWNKILVAAGTNDYTTAILTCRKLSNDRELTPEQRAAINTTLAAVSGKMIDAAQKGDAMAAQAVAEVRKGWR